MQRAHGLSRALATGLIWLLAASRPVYAEDIAPSGEWGGGLADAKLAKAAPASGVITNKADFAKLCKAWMLPGMIQLPTIDFDKQFVAVLASKTKTLDGIALRVDNGNAKVIEARGPNSGKKVAGFSYAMGVFKRDGIKTVNGKALSK